MPICHKITNFLSNSPTIRSCFTLTEKVTVFVSGILDLLNAAYKLHSTDFLNGTKNGDFASVNKVLRSVHK